MAMPLTRDDWAEAGLTALAEQGLRGVAVEPLARRLGATKGSFYWHFADRAELVDATLELWERRETTDVIERIEAIADPRERLAALGSGAYAGAARGNAHAAVVAAAADPRVAAVLARATRARLALLTRLYADLGLPAGEADRRARVAYALYLGIEQLRRSDGVADVEDLVASAVKIMMP
jgi:AcrR family transcriptional regulator